jgi:hypothetical protein
MGRMTAALPVRWSRLMYDTGVVGKEAFLLWRAGTGLAGGSARTMLLGRLADFLNELDGGARSA